MSHHTDHPGQHPPAGRSTRTFLWTGFDQGLSATANLLGTVLVARSGSAEDLGVFSLAFALYLAGLGLVRAAVGDPLVVSGVGRREIAAVWSPVWVVAAPALLVGSFLFFVEVHVAAVVVIALPALFLQSALRYAAFARRQPQLAALSDGTWVLATLGIGLAVVEAGSPASGAAVWAGGGAVAAVIAVISMRAWPATPRESTSSLRLVGRDLAGPLSVESLALTAASTLLVPVALASISLDEAGVFRAAATVVGPVAVAMTAWELYSFPAIANARESIVMALARRNAWLGGSLGMAALLMTVAANAPLQDLLFAGAIQVPLNVVVTVGAALVLTAPSGAAQALLKRWRLGRTLLKIRLLSLIPGIVLAGLGLSTSTVLPILMIPATTMAAFAALAWIRVELHKRRITSRVLTQESPSPPSRDG